jgi:O-antigen/teichoic acid export membrane protein
MAGIGEKEKQLFLDNQFENLRTVSIFLFPVIAFIAFRAQDVLFFLSKETLKILTLPFQIIVWAIILIYYDVLLMGIAWVLNKKRIILSTAAMGVISLALLIFYLAPRYGLTGLSITILITSVIVFVFIAFSLAQAGIKLPLYKYCEKPAVATMAMTLVLSYMDSLGLALAFISGAFSYVLIFLIITVLDK